MFSGFIGSAKILPLNSVDPVTVEGQPSHPSAIVTIIRKIVGLPYVQELQHVRYGIVYYVQLLPRLFTCKGGQLTRILIAIKMTGARSLAACFVKVRIRLRHGILTLVDI